jgi:hypothetical protein
MREPPKDHGGVTLYQSSQRGWPVKKVMTVFLVMGFLAGAAFAQAPEKKATFNVNAGVVGATGWGSVFFSLGMGVDIAVGKHWTVSPEVQMITYQFRFEAVILAPAILLNYSPKGNFFVGAGLGLPILVSGDVSEAGQLCAVANVGYRGNHFFISGYFATAFEGMFSSNFFGARIGYRF